MSIDTLILDGKGQANFMEVNRYNQGVVTTATPPVPEVGTTNVYEYYRNSAAMTGMNVNGAVTTQTYQLGADTSGKFDIILRQAVIIVADTAITMNRFGNIASAPNAFDLVLNEGGTDLFLLQNISTNGELLVNTLNFYPFGSGAAVNVVSNWTGTEDALIATLDFDKVVPGGLRLGRGTTDYLEARIKADLTGLTEFEIIFFGYKHIDDSVNGD